MKNSPMEFDMPSTTTEQLLVRKNSPSDETFLDAKFLECPDVGSAETLPGMASHLSKPVACASAIWNSRRDKPIKCGTILGTWREKSSPLTTVDESSELSDKDTSDSTEMNELEIQGARVQIFPSGMSQPKMRLTAGTDNVQPAGVHSQPKTTEEVLIATRIISSRVGAQEVVADLVRDHKILALDCKDPSDEIALVLLATCFGQCYVFDMHARPKMMMQGRLQECLKSKNLVKLLHDCFEACVLLYKEFRVRLGNIVDTTCAFNIIKAQQSLQHLLKDDDQPVYLNLVSGMYRSCLLNLAKNAMQRLQRQNPKLWEVRAVSEKVIDFVAQHVPCFISKANKSMMCAINSVMKPFLDPVALIHHDPINVVSNENSLEPSVVCVPLSNDSNLLEMNLNKEEVISNVSLPVSISNSKQMWPFLPDNKQSMPNLTGNNSIPCGQMVQEVSFRKAFEDLNSTRVLSGDEDSHVAVGGEDEDIEEVEDENEEEADEDENGEDDDDDDEDDKDYEEGDEEDDEDEDDEADEDEEAEDEDDDEDDDEDEDQDETDEDEADEDEAEEDEEDEDEDDDEDEDEDDDDDDDQNEADEDEEYEDEEDDDEEEDEDAEDEHDENECEEDEAEDTEDEDDNEDEDEDALHEKEENSNKDTPTSRAYFVGKTQNS